MTIELCAACRIRKPGTRLCTSCVDRSIVAHPSKMGRKVVAKVARRAFFPWTCEVHGVDVPHHTANLTCVQCGPAGAFRAPGIPQTKRAAARKAGDSRYVDTCGVHGDVDHHTNTGKCLTCFNATGLRRPAPPPASLAAALGAWLNHQITYGHAPDGHHVPMTPEYATGRQTAFSDTLRELQRLTQEPTP